MDRKSIEHIAMLAKLEINEKELDLYAGQLSKILDYFNELSQVNTKDVEPLVTPTDIEYSLRHDEVKTSVEVEEFLKSSPARVGNLYKVPPVV